MDTETLCDVVSFQVLCRFCATHGCSSGASPATRNSSAASTRPAPAKVALMSVSATAATSAAAKVAFSERCDTTGAAGFAGLSSKLAFRICQPCSCWRRQAVPLNTMACISRKMQRASGSQRMAIYPRLWCRLQKRGSVQGMLRVRQIVSLEEHEGAVADRLYQRRCEEERRHRGRMR